VKPHIRQTPNHSTIELRQLHGSRVVVAISHSGTEVKVEGLATFVHDQHVGEALQVVVGDTYLLFQESSWSGEIVQDAAGRYLIRVSEPSAVGSVE